MINTFLFDLDGTLLPMEWSDFEKLYFKKLASKLSDYFEPQLLIKYIWKSTVKMIENTGGKKTNQQVFFEDFVESTGKDINILVSLFDDFYNREYKEIGALVKSEAYVVKTIELLTTRGYDVVVATNPLFPIEAIVERIRWAGLDPEVFKYISSYEKMHYCKPNIEFYRELLQKINKEPYECIMVGNDEEEDIISSKLGIKTFLVENHKVCRKDVDLKPDYRGSYEELYKFVVSDFPLINK